MDGKRFDDLSKVLGTAVTRQSVFQLLAGIGTAGIAALTGIDLADAKKGKGKGANAQKKTKGKDNGGGGAQAEGKHKKGKGKGKHKNKKKKGNSNPTTKEASTSCFAEGKMAVCHAGNPDNPGNIICVDISSCGGHDNHKFDCLCGEQPADCSTLPPCSDVDQLCTSTPGQGADCPACASICGSGDSRVCCADTETCCDGKCVADSAFCGGTCNVCDQNQTCCDDVCTANSSFCGDSCNVCKEGETCCDGVCTDNTTFCGDACNVCGENQTCCDGVCKDNSTFCGGTCNVCGQGETCCDGVCKANSSFCGDACNICGGQQTCCDRVCKDNSSFCGQACNVCDQNQTCCDAVCKANSTFCGDTCNVCGENQTCCDDVCKANSSFCGPACNVCKEGETCCGGICITEEQCCEVDECVQKLCQIRDCVEHECDYTPVKDNEQGPLCNDDHEFCCGGDDCCKTPEVCFEEACCTPLTCSAFEGECGTFDDLCGGTVTCSCPEGQGCCDKQCFEGGNECCADADCKEVICQVADCNNGDCQYTNVPDNEQGPLCTGEDQFCCGGDECCETPEVCFGGGCCTPLTCADYEGRCGTFTDNCGGAVTCGCGEGEQCCEAAKVCVADDACCPDITCDEVICKVADCVGTQCNYTPVKDNEQGPLCDEQGEFCCGGDECCIAGQVCTGEGCCTPLTCADFEGRCGTFQDGCGGELSCSCPEGQGCCEGQCTAGGNECCEDPDCPAEICQEALCNEGDCDYTPVEDGQQGPLCTDEGDFCCNGNDCCEAGDLCTGQGCCTPKTCADFAGLCGPQPNGCGGQTAACTCPNPEDPCLDGVCCVPETEEEACAGAGRVCGLVSDGCGGEYDCGNCSSQQTCLAGVCLARGGKRCKGSGKAGHQCKGKKCKCKGGRRCHKRRCCEPKGDGSVHCNANSDCCPGLTCYRRQPGQHKVCLRNGAKTSSVTTTPGIALGAILTGLLAKGATRFFGSSSSDAAIALNDLGNQAEQQEV